MSIELKILCRHLSLDKANDVKICALNVTDNPSKGFCHSICVHRDPLTAQELNNYVIEEIKQEKNNNKDNYVKPSVYTQIKDGIKGNVQAVLHVNKVPLEVLNERNNICSKCEHAQKIINDYVARCKLCGCLLWSKLRLADQRCPINKWGVYKTTEVDKQKT